MDTTCLFCGIVAGSVPSVSVYKDETIMAFLNLYPSARGHLLVIPTAHSTDLLDTDPATLAKLTVGLQKLGKAMCKAFEVEGFNLVQNTGKVAGQVIPHLHFHLIPRRPNDGLTDWPSSEASEEERRQLAEQLKAAL